MHVRMQCECVFVCIECIWTDVAGCHKGSRLVSRVFTKEVC